MLVTEKKYAINTAILCLVWGTSAYSFYFTEFYMKYVPVQNVYYLAIMMGFSDMLTSFIYSCVSRRISTRNLLVLCSALLSLFATVLSVTLYVNSSPKIEKKAEEGSTHLSETLPLSMQLLYSVSIFGLRFFSALTFMGAYQATNDYFPTLLKGAIFALTNVVARLASVFSPVSAEWLENPSVSVAIVSAATALAS